MVASMALNESASTWQALSDELDSAQQLLRMREAEIQLLKKALAQPMCSIITTSPKEPDWSQERQQLLDDQAFLLSEVERLQSEVAINKQQQLRDNLVAFKVAATSTTDEEHLNEDIGVISPALQSQSAHDSNHLAFSVTRTKPTDDGIDTMIAEKAKLLVTELDRTYQEKLIMFERTMDDLKHDLAQAYTAIDDTQAQLDLANNTISTLHKQTNRQSNKRMTPHNLGTTDQSIERLQEYQTQINQLNSGFLS